MGALFQDKKAMIFPQVSDRQSQILIFSSFPFSFAFRIFFRDNHIFQCMTLRKIYYDKAFPSK